MRSEKFLTDFRPDLLTGDIDKMLSEGKIQDKADLTEYLGGALSHLKTYPGPNLQYRRDHADDWIGWWVNFLDSPRRAGKLIPFDKIKESLTPGTEHGVLFSGGLEGHGGHRFAVDWMLKSVRPILLLERDGYVREKERGGPYLDLRARASMWTLYNPRITVSVLPEIPKGVNPSVYYQDLFDQTGADYCFASESDPNYAEKIARGKAALFTSIPALKIQHTTHKVEKLWSEEDEEETNRILNTTDTVRKLLVPPDIDDLTELLHPELTEI